MVNRYTIPKKLENNKFMDIKSFFLVTICFSPFVIGCDKIEQERTNGHDSVAIAQKFVRDSPSDPNAYADLGNAWRDQGQYKLAIENHKKSLSLDNKNAMTHAELGDDYILDTQKDNARAEWRKALQLDTHVPPTDTRLHIEEMLKKYQ